MDGRKTPARARVTGPVGACATSPEWPLEGNVVEEASAEAALELVLKGAAGGDGGAAPELGLEGVAGAGGGAAPELGLEGGAGGIGRAHV